MEEVEPVTIMQEDDGYQLNRNEKPYFIKGARIIADKYMDKVAEYGGNSIRIGYSEDAKDILDESHSLGLTVMFGLPFKAEREGFDYDDKIAVQEQYELMKEIVNTYKNHPAILLWAIGNELDHIPGNKDYNLKMWDAVNDVAKMIKEEDPAHPAMTVVGTGRMEKLKDLVERCPDLDLLGVNAYADIGEIPQWLRKYNWNRPYAITEWGVSGHWEVPKTKYGVAIEESSTKKANIYHEKYENVIASDPWCVGSYVFLWTSNRQEHTHTWYNMFYDNGIEKGTVEVMHYVWTGEWPDNKSPRLESLTIEGMKAEDNIELDHNKIYTASVDANDPDNDSLKYEWELVPENKAFGAYAGQGETKPPVAEGAIREKIENGKTVKFEVPDASGDNYRLFVYVYDGQGKIAVANIPFYVN
ncbi:glycoside hydrolase family 2 TIM barrel-domain containing protein [Algoriphagus sp. C2-6-M1]|uniref:glycoside hydrolase family 2 TIM barrel-domain containing protein n=1 Tax=Algoriphagus persicinus TaxID=3108754 RepID=UPI002B3CD481|nr:glycoside hydrolase family 2 TIM barrel-domain containing protein [Algoriphagus sp. C2-6-M1]MEB2782252.1 glycoside hydrolase family 2 TIM barrel-domain containing protein [Algoriphagus sp. C2-6-M1]